MSPRDYAQRTAASAVAFVATLSLGIMAGQVADAAGAEQVIDTSKVYSTTPIAAEISVLQGQADQLMASREHNTPWQTRLRRETAWLISPYLIERQTRGRWKTMRA